MAGICQSAAGEADAAAEGDGSLAATLIGTFVRALSGERSASAAATRSVRAATCRSVSLPGVFPDVVGPHMMRMFIPASAAGGSPLPGSSPLVHVMALVKEKQQAILDGSLRVSVNESTPVSE